MEIFLLLHFRYSIGINPERRIKAAWWKVLSKIKKSKRRLRRWRRSSFNKYLVLNSTLCCLKPVGLSLEGQIKLSLRISFPNNGRQIRAKPLSSKKEHKWMTSHQSLCLISKYQTKEPHTRDCKCKMYGKKIFHTNELNHFRKLAKPCD